MNSTTTNKTKAEKKKPIICLKDVAVAYQSNVAIFDVNLDIYQKTRNSALAPEL